MGRALWIWIIVTWAFAGCAHGPRGPRQPLRLQSLESCRDLLVGDWVRRDGALEVRETWLQVHPRLILGSATTTRGEEPRFVEHLQIALEGDRATYLASIPSQETTAFQLVQADAGLLVFEYPAHDHPQRIIYRRLPEGPGPRLEARIESDAADGEIRGQAWGFMPATPSRRPEPIEKQIDVAAPPAEVYRALTTEAGVVTFFAPAARVEARPFGPYEMHFVPDAPAGSRGGEGCFFVELVPDRRVAFTWNFPPSLPHVRQARTLVTLFLEPGQGQQTRVRLRQVGFRAGPQWPEGRAYFERAWGIVLERLRKRFAEGPIDWSAP